MKYIFLRDPLVGCDMLWACRKEKMKKNANEGARRTMDAMEGKRSAVVLWKAREL